MPWASPRRLFLLLLLIPLNALAAQERLSVSQSPDGSIMITVSGIRDCSGSPNPQAPTVSVAGSSISLISVLGPTLAVACGPADPTFPYSVAANVGHLADGNYTATWSFVGFPPPPFSTSFGIGGGVLLGVIGVPTLSPWALLGLTILIACATRYAPRKGPSP